MATCLHAPRIPTTTSKTRFTVEEEELPHRGGGGASASSTWASRRIEEEEEPRVPGHGGMENLDTEGWNPCFFLDPCRR
jgi:hypothetical protein